MINVVSCGLDPSLVPFIKQLSGADSVNNCESKNLKALIEEWGLSNSSTSLIIATDLDRSVYESLSGVARVHGLKIYIVLDNIQKPEFLSPLLPFTKGIFFTKEDRLRLSQSFPSKETAIYGTDNILNALEIFWTRGVANVFVNAGIGGGYIRSIAGKGHIFSDESITSTDLENPTFAAAIVSRMLVGDSTHDAALYGLAARELKIIGKGSDVIELHNLIEVKKLKQKAIKLPEFQPIESDKSYCEADMLISSENLRKFLQYRKLPAHMESDLIPVLSAPGLALIASEYNLRKDKFCDIVVASLNADLSDFIRKFNGVKDGARVVVIFHATDGMNAIGFNCNLHKCVVYLEKLHNKLHVVHADTIPFESVRDYMYSLVQKALAPDESFVYYKQAHIPHPSGKGNLLLQNSFTQCGTHALRIARKIAEQENFLENLTINSTQGNVRYYEIPPFLAINAASPLMRNEMLKLFATRSESQSLLRKHFDKHASVPYAQHFTEKFKRSVQDMYATHEGNTEELDARIQGANCKRYKIE